MYGLRRTCTAITSFLFSACTIHLINLPAQQSASNLNQGLYDLQSMSDNHALAGRCIQIIRNMAAVRDNAEESATTAMPEAVRYKGWLSPPSMNFSTTLRSESSAGSASSHQESPFPGPEHLQRQRGSVPNSSNSLNQQELYQEPNETWLPFLMHGVSLPSHNVVGTLPVGYSMPDHDTQWSVIDRTEAGLSPETHADSAQVLDTLDMHDMARFADWSWQ